MEKEDADSAAFIARQLLCKVTGKTKEQILADRQMYVSDEALEIAEQLVKRILADEPLAYVLGEWEFYGMTLMVTPSVLIPRDDTCAVTDLAIQQALYLGENPRILDLCTGSGCIGLAIASRVNDAKVTLADISRDALQVARKNISAQKLSARVSCVQVNALEEPAAFLGKFDMIVSNPPYTPANSGLKSSADARMIARHEVLGSLEDFLRGASVLLDDRGDLFLVHRPSRMVDVLTTCRRFGLEPKTLQLVSGKQGESPNLMLLHCVRNGGRELRLLPQQYAREQDGTFSEWMGNNYKCIEYIRVIIDAK
jgi:HemK-like putative methylase